MSSADLELVLLRLGRAIDAQPTEARDRLLVSLARATDDLEEACRLRATVPVQVQSEPDPATTERNEP